MGRGRGGRARSRRGPAAPGGRGPQLHRRLSPHRPLSAAAAVHARGRGRRRGRGAWRGRHSCHGRRPGRLWRADRRLCRAAADRRRPRRPPARRHFIRAGGGDDAPGHDRADAAALSVPGGQGRHHPDPRRGGRRWADPLPMGGGDSAPPSSAPSAPRRKPSSPAPMAAPIRSSIRNRTSSPRCCASPTAKSFPWSTIRSAATRSCKSLDCLQAARADGQLRQCVGPA